MRVNDSARSCVRIMFRRIVSRREIYSGYRVRGTIAITTGVHTYVCCSVPGTWYYTYTVRKGTRAPCGAVRRRERLAEKGEIKRYEGG